MKDPLTMQCLTLLLGATKFKGNRKFTADTPVSHSEATRPPCRALNLAEIDCNWLWIAVNTLRCLTNRAMSYVEGGHLRCPVVWASPNTAEVSVYASQFSSLLPNSPNTDVTLWCKFSSKNRHQAQLLKTSQSLRSIVILKWTGNQSI